MMEAADAAAPKIRIQGPDDLLRTWKSLHLRTEAVFQAAGKIGISKSIGKAEREKGSQRTEKHSPGAAAHHRPETIQMRRVKRLHRRAIELARQKTTTDRYGFTRLDLTATLTPTLAAF